jgi:sulfur-oxidizing protein SoxY
MIPRPAPSEGALSRRGFLGLVAVATAGGVTLGPSRGCAGGPTPAAGEPPALLRLTIPPLTENGAKVPVVVETTHPMEPSHHVTRIHVVNPRDPVPSKGVFHFTPANGQAYHAFQARMDDGVSEVIATAECNRGGRWSTTRSITVADGGGGCAGLPPAGRIDDEIGLPRIRIPEVVRRGWIRPDEIIDVQVKIKHPNRTGLVRRDGRFVQDGEPFHITDLTAFYDNDRVSLYTMTSALSDNPFVTFRLRTRQGGLLRVVLRNNRGQRFEAQADLRTG